MVFTLHERLAVDTLSVAELDLCCLLLMNNAAYPWLILVPRRENIREITDLSGEDRLQLMEEIALVSKALQDFSGAFKMNVAALGNMVPQLHIHIIARFEHDRSWPHPVWGSGGEPYLPQAAQEYIACFHEYFENNR